MLKGRGRMLQRGAVVDADWARREDPLSPLYVSIYHPHTLTLTLTLTLCLDISLSIMTSLMVMVTFTRILTLARRLGGNHIL